MKPLWRLLIAVVVLGAVVAVLEWPKKSTPAPSAKSLVTFDAAAVRHITINQPGQPQVALSRDHGVWQLDAPYTYPADSATVATVLDSLGNIKGAQNVGPATNLAAFGLDNPSTVTLALADGKVFAFNFGSDSPTGGNSYLRLGTAGNVEMADSAIKASVLKSAFEMQDKTPVHFPSSQVNRIEVTSKGKSLTISQTNNAWPKDQQDNVQSLLDGLSDGQMSAMIDPTGAQAAAHGLNQPTTSLTLVWDGGSAQLDIGAKQDANDDYARNSSSPAVFTLASYLVDDINALFTPAPPAAAATSPATPGAVSGSAK